jgi:hypothetical protein
MPEQDFELYLSLLSRFLRLKPAQHSEIADELRDHLEQRLEELASKGLSHDEAIRQALDEFGDAAELANHFTRAAHIRRRRLIMRCTLGTVGTLAASLLVATAFWPATPHNGIAVNAVAENTAAESPPATKAKAEPAANVLPSEHALPPGEKWGFLRSDRESEKIVATLNLPTEVNFVDLPLEDAINYLRDYHKINIIIDLAAMQDLGVARDQPISLQHSGVSFRSTLRLMLEPLGLTYIVEDEVLKITSPRKAMSVIAVYNIRDMVGPHAAILSAGGERERPAIGLTPVESVPVAREGAGAVIPANNLRKPPVHTYQTTSLAELVTQTIEPVTWIGAGGDGSAIQYDGVLVIRNSHVVHEQVRSFLKLLRRTLDEPEARSFGLQ